MFRTMTSVLDKRKTPSAQEINKIPSFIFCRWLSGNPHTIQAANLINMYDKIPMESQFHMIRSAFGGKVKFIPYPKNVTAENLHVREIVAKHFKITVEKAQEYLELIDEKELQQIVDLYT